MLLLNRYWAAKKDEGKIRERRPFIANECDSLEKAEKFRLDIVGEVSRKVTQIQNPGLGEFRIRDLNDEINKLIREKRHWEERILELGGPDFNKRGPKMLDHEGKEVPGNRGYKYFGAARDLPGVRELFEKKPPKPARLTRGDLARRVNADYYGYRDEDGGTVTQLEMVAEKEAIEQAKQEEPSNEGEKQARDEEDIYACEQQVIIDSDEEGMDIEWEEGEESVAVPTQQEIEEMLVRRRKKELLEKYTSEMLVQQSENSKVLLGLS